MMTSYCGYIHNSELDQRFDVSALNYCALSLSNEADKISERRVPGWTGV